MKRFIYAAATALALAGGATAQDYECSFEAGGYKAVSTYDTWEESPFRTGQLAGQAAVIDNPHRDAINGTGRVLAFHRSQWGSHLYGARVDLQTPQPFAASPRYLHVMIHKPARGKAALVVLGKRSAWAGQSPETVQLVTPSLNEIEGGKWCDAVFMVRGNTNAEVHSFVIAPDTERNPASQGSYTALIDNIVLNDDPTPRGATEPYQVAFDTDATVKGGTPPLSSVAFTSPDGAGGKLMLSTSPLTAYQYISLRPLASAKPGDRVTLDIRGGGTGFACNVYADWDNDGMFSTTAADGTGTQCDEFAASTPSLVPDSAGTGCTMSFAVPEYVKPGNYRLRLKIMNVLSSRAEPLDPTDVDTAAGGRIIDCLVNVHAETVNAGFVARMCDVSSIDGGLAPSEAKWGEDLRFNLRMDSDYRLTGLEVKHGHDLAGPQHVNGNQQWSVDVINVTEDGQMAIPAEMVDGDVSVTILFTNK